jgi:PAS domain S-box-containing protein
MQRSASGSLLEDLDELRARTRRLERELAEYRELVDAIRQGDIDAVIVRERNGENRVYTLETADRPYRFLVEQMQEGAVTLSEEGVVLYCNPRVADMLGVPHERIIAHHLSRFLLQEDVPRFTQLLNQARQSGVRGELTFLRSKASDIPVHASFSPILSGGTILLCGILTDLTEQTLRLRQVADANARLLEEKAEREGAEDALRQAQKMQAVGQLTGGIAHDFNNMLQAIGGCLELAHRRIEQGRAAEIGPYVDKARQATGRAAALTNRLLAFARRQALHPRPVNLDDLIEGMGELLRGTVGPEIIVEWHLDNGQASLLCDQNQLENALLNVAINARDAMPQGGRLTISTRKVRLSDSDVAGQDGLKLGEYIEIAIADTGLGMDEATRSRAFEPFFTTKPVGRGTGLGLSQLYGFVRQSGGLVRLESEPGQGTTVRLYMPRDRTKADAEMVEPQRNAKSEPAADHACVLLVEDEGDVRLGVAEWLRELGYLVLEAQDGPAALELLGRTTDVDLLVTDVGLPNGLNGRQVADAARERVPGLPVLFITGYAGPALADELEADMQVIGKPFTLDALTAQIGGILVKKREQATCSTAPRHLAKR